MTTKNKETPKATQADFEYCEAIIKKHSKSFYVAFSQLEPQRAQAIYAVYAFCRLADDLVDNEQDGQKLTRLHQELSQFECGQIPDQPMWRALATVFAEFEMDIQPFHDMLQGQAKDLTFEQPETIAELAEYAYYVAGSVGLMLLPILSTRAHAIQLPAKQLGEAMQITNILRDIGEDYQNARIYLPQELMTKYGVTQETLQNQAITPEFIALWEELAQRGEALYEESLTMMPLIEPNARQALLSALFIYREILAVIRKKGYTVFRQKHKVSLLRKKQLMNQTKVYL
ncbi:MAG: phytoene/squalene synthase family protein [Enterococcus sp.]